MKKMIARIAFAAVAIPLLVFLVFWENDLPFKLVVLAFLAGAFLEMGQMAKGKSCAVLYFSGLYFVTLFWLPASGFRFLAQNLQTLLFLGLLLLFAEFVVWRRPLAETVPAVSTTFFGAFYVGILGSYVLLLRNMAPLQGVEGSWHLMILFAATWAYDTGGYFFGKKWGRHPLAPRVSPKKTWEGCFGGLLLAILTLMGIRWFVPEVRTLYGPLDMAVLGVLLSFFGQVGDLVESMIKRSFAVKDSGTLLPGHGGLFDRIDSLLMNAPVLYFYIHFFLR